jgi:hypothetical protein
MALSQQQINTLIVKGSQDQGPEREPFNLLFTALTQVSTPSSIRTDRKVKWIDVKFRGRVHVGAAVATYRAGPLALGTPLFSLFQQLTLHGDHLQFGNQQPVVINGETLAEFLAQNLKDYVPWFTVNGVKGAALGTAIGANNDVEFVLPIPTYPIGISMQDANFYCLHGPDWPGNLYLDMSCADGTALGDAAGNTTFTAYGSAAGSPSIDIYTERPLLSKALAALIHPAITFLIEKTQQPTAAVSAGGGAGSTLLDLKVGLDTTRIFSKFGTAQAGVSAGVSAFATLLDTVAQNTVISLDNRILRFQGANGDAALQDYLARSRQRTQHVGYREIDFISTPGDGPDNPKAAFLSSQLTAARKFQLVADVTAAAGQVASVVQEMTMGTPSLG